MRSLLLISQFLVLVKIDLNQNVIDLCSALRFLIPEKMVVVIVTDQPIIVHLPNRLSQKVQLIPTLHGTPDWSQVDFLMLDQLPRQQRMAWLRKAADHQIPVVSLVHQSPTQAFLAWNGTGKKRFQTYINRDLMESHHLRAKLPAITTVHLLRNVAENPICTTPNHMACLPWNP